MSEKLPRVSYEKVIKVVEKLGFSLVRQSGSHKIYKNDEGIRITVPCHSGRTLHPKVLRNIIQDLGISVDEFIQLL